MNKDTRKRYYCKCPECGHEFWACKSIFQQDFGMLDMGSGSCPKCKTYHNLTVDEKSERMIVTPWEEHIKKKKNPSGKPYKILEDVQKTIEEACEQYKYRPNTESNRQMMGYSMNDTLNKAIQEGVINENISFKVERNGAEDVDIWPLFNGRKIVIDRPINNLSDLMEFLTGLNEDNVQYADEIKPLKYISFKAEV